MILKATYHLHLVKEFPGVWDSSFRDIYWAPTQGGPWVSGEGELTVCRETWAVKLTVRFQGTCGVTGGSPRWHRIHVRCTHVTAGGRQDLGRPPRRAVQVSRLSQKQQEGAGRWGRWWELPRNWGSGTVHQARVFVLPTAFWFPLSSLNARLSEPSILICQYAPCL